MVVLNFPKVLAALAALLSSVPVLGVGATVPTPSVCIQSTAVDQYHFVWVAQKDNNVVCHGYDGDCIWYTGAGCDPVDSFSPAVWCADFENGAPWCQIAAIHLGLGKVVRTDAPLPPSPEPSIPAPSPPTETEPVPSVPEPSPPSGGSGGGLGRDDPSDLSWIRRGIATRYDPSDPVQNHGYVNMGSCDNIVSANDVIVAVNEFDYDRNNRQGLTWCLNKQCIEILDVEKGKIIQATVADRCQGCEPGQLDLTWGTLRAFGRDSDRVFPIQWRLC